MSRSGYSDDCDDILQFGRWRGIVSSATRGKRGQTLFKDLLAALDAMPVKELIRNKLKDPTGNFCTLGVLAEKRGLEIEQIDPEDADQVGTEFDIAAPLAQEIVYMNDEACSHLSPADRWAFMRKWVQDQIR